MCIWLKWDLYYLDSVLVGCQDTCSAYLGWMELCMRLLILKEYHLLSLKPAGMLANVNTQLLLITSEATAQKWTVQDTYDEHDSAEDREGSNES